jgi:hypothetical protein
VTRIKSVCDSFHLTNHWMIRIKWSQKRRLLAYLMGENHKKREYNWRNVEILQRSRHRRDQIICNFRMKNSFKCIAGIISTPRVLKEIERKLRNVKLKFHSHFICILDLTWVEGKTTADCSKFYDRLLDKWAVDRDEEQVTMTVSVTMSVSVTMTVSVTDLRSALQTIMWPAEYTPLSRRRLLGMRSGRHHRVV